MLADVYARISISPTSGYVLVDQMVLAKNIGQKYQEQVSTMQSVGQRYESFEGYKLTYLRLTVRYDGRKKSISQDDVLEAMESEGLCNKVGSSMLGGFFLKTDELEKKLQEQLYKRKCLAGMVS
ncbi:hypothetical protein ACQUY5_25085 [Bacillus cereus]|uniref:hypothetical protein n=1 Tax=Bacillus cereus TaxID=1396 RepID=UPI003D1649A8